MGQRVSKSVLITGCSSGIGHATAARLARAGYTVYASARRVESLSLLAALGCKLLALDVTDEPSMADAVARVELEQGAVDVLINNAGYGQSGAIESVSVDQARRQFETNVFGAMRLAQLVLPGMRRQGSGRIVMLSSMGGKLTLPGYGVYHASKYALEALSDALRYEVLPFGVRVVLIEPGLIRSEFGNAAIASLNGEARGAGPYSSYNDAIALASKEAYERGPLARLGGAPDHVARVIERALAARRPRARYTVTPSAKLLLFQRAVLPDWAWDAFLRTQFPQPSEESARLVANAQHAQAKPEARPPSPQRGSQS